MVGSGEGARSGSEHSKQHCSSGYARLAMQGAAAAAHFIAMAARGCGERRRGGGQGGEDGGSGQLGGRKRCAWRCASTAAGHQSHPTPTLTPGRPSHAATAPTSVTRQQQKVVQACGRRRQRRHMQMGGSKTHGRRGRRRMHASGVGGQHIPQASQKHTHKKFGHTSA